VLVIDLLTACGSEKQPVTGLEWESVEHGPSFVLR